MYTLKSIVRRGSALGAAVAVFAAAIVPTAPVFADALNPLTERSLLLSSSAPGYKDTDGSNNSETNLNANGETFAVPGSGPNGKKTGETFTFNVSSDSTGANDPVRGISFQYCTSAAGKCQSPGDNWKVNGATSNSDNLADGDGDFRNGTDHTTDGRATNAVAHPLGFSDFEVVGTFAEGVGDGQFEVLVNNAPTTGWSMDAIRAETADHTGTLTGKMNYIRLVNSAGVQPAAGQKIQVIFHASTNTYITNPGSGAFFVKINTYSSSTPANLVASDPSIIDGGVTVANVMTDSIHITTKVLETMAFSVGTENRDTVDIGSGQVHGKCDAILQPNNNRLQLGNPDAEYSLEVGKAYDVNSYWRLSSNSSGGATVYYSGNTLANTVGDEIKEMANEVVSTPGTEQFGLGFVDAGLDTKDNGAATWAAGSSALHEIRSFPFRTLDTQTGAPYNTLAAQLTSADYNEATGSLYDDSGATVLPGTAKFKFLKSSSTVPEPIAKQDETVISCATAKMRYVGNIGADTPAGVYTTKINYLAAPQY
ncbi:hypothetical protein I8H89_00500 [Candidatus Saccharibacteria bacterium]|nr:hypothetical protein [Candidatus Saccharibacteria bacterium]